MPAQARFHPIMTPTELEQEVQQAGDAPLLLFLHDPYCPISAEAYEEVSTVPHPVTLIDVSRGREMSREVERRTGVRHESPQLFVLRQGRAEWSASHYAITAAAIERALEQSASPPAPAE